MKYTRKVLFAVLFAATSVIAAEHDNNIIYKDGETLKIQSKIGIEAQLIGDGTEFTVIDKDSDAKILEVGKFETGLNRIKLDGNSASNLVVDIVDSRVGPLEQRVAAVEEAIPPLDNRVTQVEEAIEDLLGLRQFAVDYSMFKSITDSRFGFIYNDLGHTLIDNAGLDTNRMEKCFSTPVRSMCLTDSHGGIMGRVDADIMVIESGKDPGVETNWVKVASGGRGQAGNGKDGQPIFSSIYVRDSIYNKLENSFYLLFNGGGIKIVKAADLRTPAKWVQTSFDAGIITDGKAADKVNTYHAAVGVDGIMVATTEYGPVWKEKDGTKWHKVNIPDHDYSKAVRCIAAGSSFIKKEEAIRMLREAGSIEVKQTRDLGLARDSINDYILPAASRFVLGSTDDEGIWYSNPFDVENGWTHVTKTEGGAADSLATGFRQIVFHNGTYVAGAHRDESKNPNIPTGIFYSMDGINWKLSPGTASIARKIYEPTYALGTFVLPMPWGTTINGKHVGSLISANPEEGFLPIEAGCGYGVEEVEFGTFMFGATGVYNCKKSARLVSPVIYSKNEVDDLIKKLESKINALLPAGSLQPLE